MKEVIDVLEKQKKLSQERNKRTQNLIDLYKNHLDNLRQDHLKETINMMAIQQKIDYIKNTPSK